MIIELLIRSVLIFISCVVLQIMISQMPFNLTKYLGDAHLPLIMALSPILISRIPIFGTTNILKKGISPFISSMILIGLGFGYTLLNKEVSLEATGEYNFKKFKVKTEFLILLSLVIVTEFLIQISFMQTQKSKVTNKTK
tara:strand:+ start:2347 stop:2766 length:420 start_codon:yes stop_codon:yes gene_type:complete